MSAGIRYGEHLVSIRLDTVRRCDGCDRLVPSIGLGFGVELVTAHYAWTDTRAPGSTVCGRCVEHALVAFVPLVADPAELVVELDGQLSILDEPAP